VDFNRNPAFKGFVVPGYQFSPEFKASIVMCMIELIEQIVPGLRALSGVAVNINMANRYSPCPKNSQQTRQMVRIGMR